MFKRSIVVVVFLAALSLGAEKGIGQLNVPKSGGAASIRDVQADIPQTDTPAGRVSVSASWIASQNETLLDSIGLLSGTVSKEEFGRYKEAEKAKTAGKDQSFLLDYRNKYLHELVKGAVKR